MIKPLIWIHHINSIKNLLNSFLIQWNLIIATRLLRSNIPGVTAQINPPSNLTPGINWASLEYTILVR